MARRSGLGRGLSSLIPTEGSDAAEAGLGLRDLPVASITPNRYQPRQVFDEEQLVGLTDSIRELGVLQPVLVRPVEEGYELIAGERRWRAAKRAGLQTIPAVVRDITDVTSLEHALVENLHRQDLNPLEEAAAIQQLIEDFQLTQEQVAQRVGRSRSAVANLLRLFQLPPAVQRLVAEGSLSAGHAKALLATPDRAYQELLARRVVGEELSVREVERLLRERAELESMTSDFDEFEATRPPAAEDPTTADPGRATPGGTLRPPGLLELEQLLADHLDTRVEITMAAKKGRVVIDFADLEDLERIYRIIATESD